MVSWPCILKLEGDDELIYLMSEAEFNMECKDLILSEADCLIDSKGFTHKILHDMALVIMARKLSTDDVTQLIRAHEFTKAELCLTKIHFLTIGDAIQSLKS